MTSDHRYIVQTGQAQVWEMDAINGELFKQAYKSSVIVDVASVNSYLICSNVDWIRVYLLTGSLYTSCMYVYWRLQYWLNVFLISANTCTTYLIETSKQHLHEEEKAFSG